MIVSIAVSVAFSVIILAVACVYAFGLHPDRAFLRVVRSTRDAAVKRWPSLLAVNRTKIDTSARCPACGVQKAHVVTWNPTSRLIVHLCIQCKAEFAQAPVVSADKWQKKIVEDKG